MKSSENKAKNKIKQKNSNKCVKIVAIMCLLF